MSQTQTLRMTPQLQQAIKLLQLSRMEFETAIRKEMEENPILEELHETQEETVLRTEGERREAMEAEAPAPESDPRKQDQDDFDWENYVESNYKSQAERGTPMNDEIMNYENVITSEKTLFEHLMWQLGLMGFNDEERRVLGVLIGYIEDDGYLKTPLEDIAKDEADVTLEELEEHVPLLWDFDPPGVGARNLKECLLIQARHLQEDTHDIVHLINNHLKDLEKKNYEAISKAMNQELEDVIEMCKIIYEMEPKPGRAFVTNDTQYVTPDVYVYKVGDEYVVSLNEDGMPRLRISNFYKNALKGAALNGVTQDYIRDKLKSAVFLIKSIHQRQRTIYKVTESIVKHQRDFFDKGPAFIKPMILRDIANDIGIHESTVSRVTSNKYVHTPRGIFELKYFFNSGISKTNGESLASESVKLKIKELVDAESAQNPLSDQKIVELLKKEGIKIARRTVAKYRDVLGILPSSKRKKYF
ncbi:MAG: RNA polymerase factor sigma-54 [Bdellovibrionales bacterium]|nr:RNA polymerase factor sigma-54 [Bdellovibrionales bacterium]